MLKRFVSNSCAMKNLASFASRSVRYALRSSSPSNNSNNCVRLPTVIVQDVRNRMYSSPSAKGTSFSCGIVGMPNVGKSTLFNALTESQKAAAANFPFCTIDPNFGIVNVPDERLEFLAKAASSKRVIPTQMEFVDIAGLVKGASKGEGLGNKFLSHIRQVNAIAHMVRCYENPDVTHVEGDIDPLRDIETINTELILADYEQVVNRKEHISKKYKGTDKDLLMSVLGRCATVLEEEKPVSSIAWEEEELNALRSLQLLTIKKMLYVCNVEESAIANGGNAYSEKVKQFAESRGEKAVVVSAQLEAEAALLDNESRQEFLNEYGLKQTGLQQIISMSYDLVGLIRFYTVGEQEARAWTVRRGAKAPEAAGVIHSDFEKGFIKADTISYKDFVECGSEAECRKRAKLRSEGKNYVVEDGDIFHFRFMTK